MDENNFEQEQKREKKPNIIDRAININRRIDDYWRKGVFWFWGVMALFIVLYICGIFFNILGL